MNKYLIAIKAIPIKIPWQIVVFAIFCLALSSGTALASTRDSSNIHQVNWRAVIDTAFAHINKSQISTGILIDKSVRLIEAGSYQGNGGDSTIFTGTWWMLYGQIYYGIVDTSIVLPIPDSLYQDVHKYLNYDTVPIGIMNYKYSKIKDNAFTSSLLTIDSSASDSLRRIYNAPGAAVSPYNELRLFAAVPFRELSLFDKVKFRIDSNYYFSNDTALVVGLFINFDDGNGSVSLPFDTTVTISYSSSGTKNITVKIITSANDTLYSFSTVSIAPDNSSNQTLSVGPTLAVSQLENPDIVWQLTAERGYPNVSLGTKARGEAYVLLSFCGNTRIRRPIVLVEGYDANNERGYEDLYKMGKSFIDELRYKGYDFIIFNFNDGGDYIQRNAYLLQTLIKKINQEKEGDQEAVVIGASMGGLVSRYALADMEKNLHYKHQVRLFVSFDSPQRGANIPLGMQYMTNFWHSIIGLFSEEISKAKKALVKPAARQMLMAREDQPWDNADPAYYDLMSELAQLGYPAIRNIALINGSETQNNQGYNSHDQILQWHHNTFFLDMVSKVWAVPSPNQGEKITAEMGVIGWIIKYVLPLPPVWGWYYVEETPSYDNAPGGNMNTQQQIARALSKNFQDATNPEGRINHCFVPSISALDIATPYSNDLFYNIAAGDIVNTNKTPFDAYYSPSSINERHISFNYYNILHLIVDEIMADDLYLQNDVISSGITRDYEAQNSIISGKNVTAKRSSGEFVVANGADVDFRAGKTINLKNGFRTEKGSFFHAYISPFNCSYSISQINTISPKTGELSSQERVEQPMSECALLSAPYPNPFGDETSIDYTITEAGPVTLIVSNMFGQTVAEIVRNSHHATGTFQVKFNAGTLPAGTYFYTLRTGEHAQTKQMMIIR